MTTRTLEAVFQNGAFHPLSPSPVWSEGQHVRLVVETQEPDVLALAGAVYEGLSDEEQAEVERIALRRGDFFEASNP